MDAISLMVIALGFLFIIVGSFVRKRGIPTTITGKHGLFFAKDKKKLANRMGLVLLIFGVEMVIFPWVYLVFEGVEGYHLAIFAIFHFFLLFGTVIIDQLEM